MSTGLTYVDAPDVDTIDAEFARIVAELTRRKFLGGVAGSAALLGLGACGPVRGDTSASSSAPAVQSIDTAYGKVSVPLNPARVVCVDTYTVSALLDVGYTPVGVGDGGADFMLPEYRDAYAAIKKIASTDEQVDIEAITALHPDLILGVNYSYISDLRTKLAAIAPTAIFTWDSSGDWENMAASATAAVGRVSTEADLVSHYRKRAGEIKATYAEILASARIDLVTAGGGQAYVWLPASGVAAVLADAGVRLGAASTGASIGATADDLAVGFKAVSFELLGKLNDATAIVTTADADGKPDSDAAAMISQPVFAALPAAKARHVAAFVNFFPFSYGQALAALDELQTLLDGLRNGAPS